MGNYLNTIDGTLVNNCGAAVHTMKEKREGGKGRKEGMKERVSNLALLQRQSEDINIKG